MKSTTAENALNIVKMRTEVLRCPRHVLGGAATQF